MIEIARCQVSICGVTSSPEETSPLCTQLLYGEYCQVLEREGYYTKIQTASDDTIGWVFSQNIEPLTHIAEQYTLSHPMKTLSVDGHDIYLSMGSELSIEEEHKPVPLEHIGETAMHFLHTPYLAGGRSIFGIDASGFSQLVYKCHGIHLPRTAALQATHGRVLDFIEESEPGDLAFFENDMQEISHVGIMLEGQRIIHTFGMVRIDQLDSTGIYNTALKKHTHLLRFVKRICP